MKTRITDKHKSARGDTGYSDLALGKRISKGTSLPKIYLNFDLLQHSLSNFIEFNPDLVDSEDLLFFHYLLQMTFAVNSFLYAAGGTDYCDKYLFDPVAMSWMEDRVEWFKDQEKKILEKEDLNSEFIIPHGHINKLRLKARGVETEFWSFRDLIREETIDELGEAIRKLDSHNWSQDKVLEILQDWFIVRERFIAQGSFLNRLSSYFYWLMRYHHVKNGGTFEEWMSQAPNWSDYICLKTTTKKECVE